MLIRIQDEIINMDHVQHVSIRPNRIYFNYNDSYKLVFHLATKEDLDKPYRLNATEYKDVIVRLQTICLLVALDKAIDAKKEAK